MTVRTNFNAGRVVNAFTEDGSVTSAVTVRMDLMKKNVIILHCCISKTCAAFEAFVLVQFLDVRFCLPTSFDQ